MQKRQEFGDRFRMSVGGGGCRGVRFGIVLVEGCDTPHLQRFATCGCQWLLGMKGR